MDPTEKSSPDNDLFALDFLSSNTPEESLYDFMDPTEKSSPDNDLFALDFLSSNTPEESLYDFMDPTEKSSPDNDLIALDFLSSYTPEESLYDFMDPTEKSYPDNIPVNRRDKSTGKRYLSDDLHAKDSILTRIKLISELEKKGLLFMPFKPKKKVKKKKVAWKIDTRPLPELSAKAYIPAMMKAYQGTMSKSPPPLLVLTAMATDSLIKAKHMANYEDETTYIMLSLLGKELGLLGHAVDYTAGEEVRKAVIKQWFFDLPVVQTFKKKDKFKNRIVYQKSIEYTPAPSDKFTEGLILNIYGRNLLEHDSEEIRVKMASCACVLVFSLAKRGRVTNEYIQRHRKKLEKELHVTHLDLTVNNVTDLWLKRLGKIDVDPGKWEVMFEDIKTKIQPLSCCLCSILEEAKYAGMTLVLLVQKAVSLYPDFPWKKLQTDLADEWQAVKLALERTDISPYIVFSKRNVPCGRYQHIAYCAKQLMMLSQRKRIEGYEGLDEEMDTDKKNNIDRMLKEYVASMQERNQQAPLDTVKKKGKKSRQTKAAKARPDRLHRK